MRIKDYYKILNVPANAGTIEIRKAFRALALQYHPDRNNGDKYKEALFREVQEAYQTLSDPKSREEYNYKRWYTRSIGKSFTQEAITPSLILNEAEKLSNYMLSLNDLQVDYDLLSQRIRNILSAEHIDILLQYDQVEINHRVIRLILRTMTPLPVKYIDPITLLLVRIAGTNPATIQEIRAFRESKNTDEEWQKWSIWVVIAITLLLCWMMFKYAGN